MCDISDLSNRVLGMGHALAEYIGDTWTMCLRLVTRSLTAHRKRSISNTAGTGAYRNVGGDGTLVEFGNGKGKLTLHVLSLVP
jgi:hypothetical protein